MVYTWCRRIDVTESPRERESVCDLGGPVWRSALWAAGQFTGCVTLLAFADLLSGLYPHCIYTHKHESNVGWKMAGLS